jgi:hypothetical protein
MNNNDTKMTLVSVLSTITVLGLFLVAQVSGAYAQETASSRPQTITTISSTIPSNGDINPYGVFRVARSVTTEKRQHSGQ